MTVYQWINCFFAFSLFGYFLECLVLTYENRKLVYNRGFGHGPFCVIYGFGALGAWILLRPIADDTVQLYFASMMMATTMELVTARIMIHLFGAFWWDYSHKRYNYKGIICLQSSLAWGLLGIIFFRVLNVQIQHFVTRIPDHLEKYIAVALVLFYLSDFTYSFHEELKEREDERENREPVIGRMKVN